MESRYGQTFATHFWNGPFKQTATHYCILCEALLFVGLTTITVLHWTIFLRKWSLESRPDQLWLLVCHWRILTRKSKLYGANFYLISSAKSSFITFVVFDTWLTLKCVHIENFSLLWRGDLLKKFQMGKKSIFLKDAAAHQISQHLIGAEIVRIAKNLNKLSI